MIDPNMTRRYRVDVSYDGSNYAGWQIQPNAVTVQEVLQEALMGLTGNKVTVHGSGRTDRGVHARRQTAHFDLPAGCQIESLKKALNALLPPDIRVYKAMPADSDFHARLSAKGKEYRYFIWNGDVVPPFLYRYRTRVPAKLDAEKMRAASQYLIGEHDFRAFSANPDRPVESNVRKIWKLAISRKGSEVVISVKGSGFLYKMVRSIAGHLVRVGEGRVNPEQTKDIMESRKRTALVKTAPPQGLFLWNVSY